MKQNLEKRLWKWLGGEWEPLDYLSEPAEVRDSSRESLKEQKKHLRESIDRMEHTQAVVRAEQKGFYAFYTLTAVICCLVLIGVLLYSVANVSEYGVENPLTMEVVGRYVSRGLYETGAVNVVSGMILDYRAFDTLGESHVLFTALVCVLILLHRDRKNMLPGVEDYYTVSRENYYELSGDPILRTVGMVLLPCIFLYGIYVLLNGQNSPGGGFSGGTVMGSALIILSACVGFARTDRFFTRRMITLVIFVSLAFYSLAKGYVFFMGANGLENHIPKGVPGTILSGGLILPLNIAVGMVVACTMYGFYSLFKRGSIGEDGTSLD